MPWVAQDDAFFTNPKARAVGPFGRELFAASWCWCSQQLNDGLFVAEDVPVIAALAQVPPSIADLLYSHGMWHPEGADCAKCRVVGQAMPVPAGRVAVHEYLKQNKTKAKVVAERERAARRQRLSRGTDHVATVKRRDGDNCRYCGRTVNWKDRRSAAGATLDHVDPDGADDADNLVVACRGCNAKKRDRTPGEAGLVLLLPRTNLEVPEAQSQSPNSDTSSSRPGNSQGTSPPVDNPTDDGVPAAVWEQYAVLKLKREPPGKVRNTTSWKATTRVNARTEHAATAASWLADFDVTPTQLAACLVDGKPPSDAYRRRAPA